jgi:hypothetical protein
MPEPIFMKVSTYIIAPEPISMAYFIILPISLFLYVYPLLDNGKIEEMLDSSFSMQSVTYQRWVCRSVCSPIVARWNLSKTSPRQQRIVEGVVSYEVRVVSKDIRRLVLPKTSSPVWRRGRIPPPRPCES